MRIGGRGLQASVWSAPGMTALAALSFTGFAGYAVLLPVAPLWAVHGGADSGGAGLVNGVLLLATVLTQLLVPSGLRRFGWRPVLVVGMVLLGVPALALLASDGLGPVLGLSAARGLGFGVLTVTGSAAVVRLVDPSRRGAAIGAYGLAIALPNLVLLPLGPWMADHVGFWLPFAISGLPLLGIAPALRLARLLEDDPAAAPAGVLPPDLAGRDRTPAAESLGAAYLRLLRPVFLLLVVTLAGGAVITFAPQLVAAALVTTLGLFVLGLAAAVARWRVGALADRHGAERFVWPLLVLTAAGMALIALAVPEPARTRVAVLLVGMALTGIGYGALQNLTLVISFDAVSRPHHNLASAMWNAGFDAGTGIGSVLVGAIAVQASFTVGLLLAAGGCLVVLPLALVRPARRLAP